MTHLLLALAAMTIAASAAGIQPTAAEIMRRVAANQDRLNEDRSAYVYDQSVRVASRRKNGTIVCQQQTEYRVTPKGTDSDRQMLSTHGKYWRNDHYVQFDKDLPEDQRTLDTGMVRDLRDQLVQGKEQRDQNGLAADLFPLTSKQQEGLEFMFDGTRAVEGRTAYIVRFRPKDRKELRWAGEATIDQQDFEPVTIYTTLSRKLPFFVRTVLGTDVPGLGFTIHYRRLADGLWFPASFGTEFRIHAVYFFHRTLSIALENSNFKRTRVETRIEYDQPH